MNWPLLMYKSQKKILKNSLIAHTLESFFRDLLALVYSFSVITSTLFFHYWELIVNNVQNFEEFWAFLHKNLKTWDLSSDSSTIKRKSNVGIWWYFSESWWRSSECFQSISTRAMASIDRKHVKYKIEPFTIEKDKHIIS